MADPVVLPSHTQIADSFMVGNPEMLQDPYRRAQDKYPLSPVLPRYTVPIEEEIATNDLVTKMQARDVQMRGMLLNQKIAQKNLEYSDGVQQQTEAALRANVLARLVPGSPNYEAEKAAIVKEFPLAVQDPRFTALFQPLDEQNSIQTRSTEVLTNQAADDARRDVASRQMLGMQLRNEAAKYGVGTLDEFDKIAGETNDPIRAFSQVSSKIQQQQAQQLADKPLTPAQVRSAKLDLVKEANKMLARKSDDKDAWTPEDEANLSFIRSEISSLDANPSNTGAQPAATKPPQSYWAKPSTKTGP